MTAKVRRIRASQFASYERNGTRAPASYRTNGAIGGVVALAAVNGPGAYQRRFGLRRPTRANAPLRAQVISTGGGHARLVFRDSAPPSRSSRGRASARLRSNSAARGREKKVAPVAKGTPMAKRSKKSKGARKRKASKRRSYRSNKRKSFRANKRSFRKKNKARRSKKATRRRSSKRAYRANKSRRANKRARKSSKRARRSSKRARKSFRPNRARRSSKRRSRKSSKRGFRRNGAPALTSGRSSRGRKGRARKPSITRGRITVLRSFYRKGKHKQRKLASYGYKGRRGFTGAVGVMLPSKRGSMQTKRATKFKANGRRRGVSRRRGFRRNGAFAPILAAFKTGMPAFGGFAGHRVLTGVIAEYAGSYLPIPEAAKVPVVSVLVAALGSIAAAAAIKGPAGPLVIAGIGLSTLSQLAMAALRAAGQDGAASAIAGIPTGTITAYGAYELVPQGVAGLGALPYAQALAAFGALPYAQALAGPNPYAARGNYVDAPSLGMGAYPEQALAAAYPEQAAAGYGAYELTPEGGVLNGIGTDAASIEQALNQADRGGAVHGFGGFGADSIGRESILIPDGVQSAVTATPELPMVAGNFAGNVFGVGY